MYVWDQQFSGQIRAILSSLTSLLIIIINCPKTAGINSSPTATQSAGIAVIEIRWMDVCPSLY